MSNLIKIEQIKAINFTKKDIDFLARYYDEYEFKIEFTTGEKKTIILYADRGTVPEGIPEEYIGREEEYKRKRSMFFGIRALQKDNEESRIYLGSFNYKDSSKPVNDVESYVEHSGQTKENYFKGMIEYLELYENGEITEEDFIEAYPELAEERQPKAPSDNGKQQSKENDFKRNLQPKSSSKKPTHKVGKHYVLGDIHGYKAPYVTALGMIKPEDSLVILGDVVDRGRDGIKIIQDLMRRKANTPESNITFILGNHEKMMFEAISYILKLHLSV